MSVVAGQNPCRTVTEVKNLPSEPAPNLPWGPTLNRRQRDTLAKLTGASERYGFSDLPDDQVLEVLLGYSDDPQLWAVVLGGALNKVDQGESAYARIVVLARRAGADEEAAGVHLRWLRAQPWR